MYKCQGSFVNLSKILLNSYRILCYNAEYTVNVLHKNPLFKNLSPYPRRDSQNSGCFKIKNLRVPLLSGSGSYFMLGGSGFVVAWLVKP